MSAARTYTWFILKAPVLDESGGEILGPGRYAWDGAEHLLFQEYLLRPAQRGLSHEELMTAIAASEAERS